MKNIIIISGISGAGKDSLLKGLKKRIKKLAETPTYTTRAIRRGEKKGIDHFYINQSQFDNLYKKGEIIEKNLYNHHWYGVSKSALDKVMAKGKIPILEIDINGFKALKKIYGEKIRGVFVYANPKDVKKRLADRGGLSGKQIDQRLEIGKNEIKNMPLYDFVIENKPAELDSAINKTIDFLRQKDII